MQVQLGLKEYENVLNDILNKNVGVLSNLHGLLHEGHSMKDICVGLHDVIIASEMENKTKFKLLRTIGESEWRSTTMTPKVLLSWMVGQLI